LIVVFINTIKIFIPAVVDQQGNSVKAPWDYPVMLFIKYGIAVIRFHKNTGGVLQGALLRVIDGVKQFHHNHVCVLLSLRWCTIFCVKSFRG
jgi:hypothetical protein